MIPTRLAWLLRRLSRMYLRELPHRLADAGLLLLHSRGWVDDARRLPPQAADARFGQPWTVAVAPLQGQAQVLAAAERLLLGRLQVFGREVDIHPDRIDWNADPVTGTVLPRRFGPLIDFRHLGPGVDIKFLWETNRHLWWVTLAQAWRLSGDARFLHALARLLGSWLAQCPYPLGPNWSSPVEHGVRLINWSLVWGLVGGPGSPMFDGPAGRQLRSAWLASIYQHIRFIGSHLSRDSSANNHLIGELAGLCVALQTWDLWADCRPLRQQARRLLEAEALGQFYADGVNAEQAFCYHKFSLQFLLAAGLCGRANGDQGSAAFWGQVESAITFVASQMTGGGEVPLYGDADEGAVFSLDPDPCFDPYRALLALGAGLFKRPDLACKLAAVPARPDAQTAWLLGPVAAAPQPASHLPQAATAALLASLPTRFAQGGYWLLGQGLHSAQETRVLMDIGPLGSNKIAGHGHADALALQVWHRGQPLLGDRGTYCYNAEPAFRRYFRSTAAHNTLQVDGEDQAAYGGSFLWLSDIHCRVLRHHDDGVVETLHACHDGYARLGDPVLHHRQVRFDRSRSELRVEDWLACREPHDVRLHWHLPPGLHFEAALDGAQPLQWDGGAFKLGLAAKAPIHAVVLCGQGQPVQGWHSDRFYHRQPAETLQASTRLKPLERITTTLQLA